MAGVLLGIILGISYVGAAVDIGTGTVALSDVYISAAVLFGFCWLVGFLFTRTLGVAAMFGMLGAAAACVVALVTGEVAFVPAFLLHAFVLLLVQHGLRQRLAAYDDMTRARRFAR